LGSGGKFRNVPFTWRVVFGSGAIAIDANGYKGGGHVDLTPSGSLLGESCTAGGMVHYLVKANFNFVLA
jgi:hypothetical protein